jgi:hypothetical protein
MKHTSRLFMALFAFFVVVAFGALYMLSDTGSVFNKDNRTPGSSPAVMSKTIVGDESATSLSIKDDFSDEETVEASELLSDADAAADEGTVPEAAESDAGASVEDTLAEADNTREKRYFTFTTGTRYTILRLRSAPSLDADILAKLNKRTPGYVILPGNEWCKVVMSTGTVGYCATEYLNMVEVSEEEFPAEFIQMVEPPQEDLDY